MIRIVKTKEKSKKQQMLLRLAAFVLALCAGGLFLLVLGNNPFAIYGTILSGAFRSEMAIQATIKIMIPLLIASLGVMLAFKMKFWNIGGEGQLIMGGVFASYFALFHADWPVSYTHLPNHPAAVRDREGTLCSICTMLSLFARRSKPLTFPLTACPRSFSPVSLTSVNRRPLTRF